MCHVLHSIYCRTTWNYDRDQWRNNRRAITPLASTIEKRRIGTTYETLATSLHRKNRHRKLIEITEFKKISVQNKVKSIEKRNRTKNRSNRDQMSTKPDDDNDENRSQPATPRTQLSMDSNKNDEQAEEEQTSGSIIIHQNIAETPETSSSSSSEDQSTDAAIICSRGRKISKK